MYNSIAHILTMIIILIIWIYLILEVEKAQEYNKSCIMMLDGHKYLLCNE